MNSGRGGDRRGAGRPVGSTSRKSDWVKLATKVSPEMRTYLDALLAEGYTVAKIMDAALRMYRESEAVRAGVCKDCGRPMHRFHNCEINPVAEPSETKDGE